MADEIDIEEHDLLDNPQIKSIFPDLSILKQEIQSYYEATETNLESVSAFGSRPQDSVTNGDTATEKYMYSFKVSNVLRATKPVEYPENDGLTSQNISKDNTPELPIIRNKIILGTKPNKKSEDAEISKTQVKLNRPKENKKVDIGPLLKRSKTSKQLEYEDFFKKQFKTEKPIVLLDDLGPYLERSNRYCEDCLILFPNKNALDNHKTSHSCHGVSQPIIKLNKSTLSYQCNKIKCNICYTCFSTRGSLHRHYRNIHPKYIKSNIKDICQTKKRQKVNNSKDIVPEMTKACFHCNISFPTQQSLIEHLYEVLQPKIISCKKCSEEFSSEDKLKDHMILHEKSKVKRKEENMPTTSLPKITLKINKIAANPPQSNNIHEKIEVRKKESASNKDTKKLSPEKYILDTSTKSTNIHKKNKWNDGNIYISRTRTRKMCPKNISQTQTKSINYLYYRCYICSYYLKNSKLCLVHLDNKHKVTKILHRKVVDVPYDAKCKYCFLEFADVSAYNTHLKETHSQHYNSNIRKKGQNEKEKPKLDQEPKPKLINTSNLKPDECEYNSFVLKSTLFKCNKCDIHFLSAKMAMNHIDHMEILINWKCNTCQRIFKKQDELLHLAQHPLCHKFVVLDLSSSALSRILYKCPKCAIHFTEHNFLSHYTVCGMKTPDSVYCKFCDILIDNEIRRSHEASHQYENLKFSDFTIVESDIIPDYRIKRRGRLTLKEKIQKTNDLKRKNEDNANVSPSKRQKVDLDYMFDVTYCNTCKCFLTEKLKRNVHLDGRCGHLVKYVCKICGLVLTAQAYKTHKRLHKRMRNLKLQDFNFYAIETGEQIYPPIPEYPQCHNCEVYFLSKTHSLSHECSNEDYLTCHLCNQKFSEGTYKLHLLFHNYSNVNVDKETLKVNSSELLVGAGKNITESDKLSQPLQSSNLVSKSFDTLQYMALEDSENDVTQAEYIFSCKNCYVVVDTYDKMIEHCQWHYSRDQKQIRTETCHVCDLKFDSTCYKNHQMLHSKLFEKQSFKSFYFDTFYYQSENNVWIKHVFGSLSQGEIESIINKSIYQFECRIKMEIIQDGPPKFTMFKCDKCRCFINGSSLYKHAENSCFKLRKHPCAFCGLPFISSESRMEHEKIHKGLNIGLKSYRIVTFNREEDKSFNNTLFRSSYVLYQCRNCCGVVDKSQINSHECNKKDLKKCICCGILLHSQDYETHQLRHTDLKSFTQNNMKIILFGEKTETTAVDQEHLVSFNGTVYDYAFYSCTKCQVCVKTFKCTLKHSCTFGLSRIKCSNCDLYFATNRFKYHRKLHESDPDFVRENMKIIAFNSPESSDSETLPQEQSVTDSFTENSRTLEVNPNTGNLTDSKIDATAILKDTEKNNGACEAIAKIYKCICGLHFLDQFSMSTHFKICNPRIRASKQKCTKCDLLFTPNILFSHLLMHHGDRKHVYKFEIIEMATRKVFLYRCSKCQLHFVKETEVKEHFETCNASENDGRKCIDCNLLFEHSSFILHEDYHKDVQREYEIIIINESLPNVLQDDCMAQKISIPQSDIAKHTDTVVNEKKYMQD